MRSKIAICSDCNNQDVTQVNLDLAAGRAELRFSCGHAQYTRLLIAAKIIRELLPT